MALRADASKQSRWLDFVQRWQRSTLTVREFCQRHQLSEPSFYSWRRVLRERGLIEAQAQPAESATPAFVKLTLDSAELTAPSAVEIVVGARLLRVRPGFDAAMLLELVRLLEEPAC
jgi:transposase-like protein